MNVKSVTNKNVTGKIGDIMSKFQVGDKVRVNSIWGLNHYPNRDSLLKFYPELTGLHTIEEVHEK